MGISVKQKLRSMPAPFFPFDRYDAFLERKALYMLEFKSAVPDDMPLLDFFWLTARAEAIREARKKAIEEGKVPL